MGTLTLGSFEIAVPPGAPAWSTPANVCPSACTAQLPGPVTLVDSFYHMHQLGTAMVTRHVRNGAEVQPPGQRDYFNFDYQVGRRRRGRPELPQQCRLQGRRHCHAAAVRGARSCCSVTNFVGKPACCTMARAVGQASAHACMQTESPSCCAAPCAASPGAVQRAPHRPPAAAGRRAGHLVHLLRRGAHQCDVRGAGVVRGDGGWKGVGVHVVRLNAGGVSWISAEHFSCSSTCPTPTHLWSTCPPQTTCADERTPPRPLFLPAPACSASTS